MTTKKKSLIAAASIVAIAAIVALTVALTRHKNDDCSAAVPASSQLVARLDLPALLTAAGLAPAALASLPQATKAKGVDLSRPAYAFVCQGYFGAVIPLSARNAFLRSTAPLHGKTDRRQGLTWTTFGGSFLMACDAGKAIVIGPATTQEQAALKATLLDAMTQAHSACPLLPALSSIPEPLAVATTPSLLPSALNGWLKAILPEGLTTGDFTLTAGLTAQDGSLSAQLSLSGSGKKAEALLSSLADALAPIDTAKLSQPEPQPFLTLCLGLNGERLLSLLRGNPSTRTALLAAGMVMDADMALKSISGNVELTLPQLAVSNPPMLHAAQLGDSAFMANVPSWNDGISADAGVKFVPARNGFYLCSWHGTACYFGLRQGNLLLTNQERLTLPAETRADSALAQLAHSQLVACRADLSQISGLLSFLPGQKSLSALSSLTLSTPDMRNWTLRLSPQEGADLLRLIIE